MREIKFKTWDNLKKEMYKPVYKAYEGNLFYLTLNIDSGVLLAHEMKGVCSASKDLDKRFELMQYTGLKDKNREESFHKDIVSAERYDNWIIEWHNNGWKLKQIGIEHYIEIPRDFIIIGNEFENPELMEAK